MVVDSYLEWGTDSCSFDSYLDPAAELKDGRVEHRNCTQTKMVLKFKLQISRAQGASVSVDQPKRNARLGMRASQHKLDRGLA